MLEHFFRIDEIGKGIVKNEDAIHVCYCHSPMRYIWDMANIYYNNFNFFEKVGYKSFINSQIAKESQTLSPLCINTGTRPVGE